MMLQNLPNLDQWQDDADAREEVICIIISCKDKDLSKTKDALIEEVETEESEYIQKVRESRAEHEKLVAKAQEQLAPQAKTVQPVMATADIMFRP